MVDGLPHVGGVGLKDELPHIGGVGLSLIGSSLIGLSLIGRRSDWRVFFVLRLLSCWTSPFPFPAEPLYLSPNSIFWLLPPALIPKLLVCNKHGCVSKTSAAITLVKSARRIRGQTEEW